MLQKLATKLQASNNIVPHQHVTQQVDGVCGTGLNAQAYLCRLPLLSGPSHHRLDLRSVQNAGIYNIVALLGRA